MEVKRIKLDGSDFGMLLKRNFNYAQIKEIAKRESDDGHQLQFMLDIETLGKPQDGLAPIVSLALLPFNRKKIYNELGFHIRINMKNYDELKFKGVPVSVNMETMMWWMNQTDEARKEFQCGDTDLHDALLFVKNYIQHIDMYASNGATLVWAKSPDFDISLCNQWLCELNKEYSRLIPYNAARCVRTTLDDAKLIYGINNIPKFGELVAHNPSDDNIIQIRQLWYCWDSVTRKINNQ